jgi:hypothetical protein
VINVATLMHTLGASALTHLTGRSFESPITHCPRVLSAATVVRLTDVSPSRSSTHALTDRREIMLLEDKIIVDAGSTTQPAACRRG